MFIPIDAKADITGSKKGKLTPAQHAQLNAWCLAEKTGILDCLDKCEATAMFYSATNNIATVVFKKGYFVICGRLVECEAGTEVQVVTPASGSVSGRIIARYNLASSGEEEFIITTTTSNLVQQDLNNNPLTGVYEFELYSYTATPTNITLTRTGDYVPDIGGKIDKLFEGLTQGTSIVKKAEVANIASYASADTSKGTIEARLTNLGFKQGTLTNLPSGVSGYIYKLGKFVIGKISWSGTAKSLSNDTTLFTIPSGFEPYEIQSADYGIRHIKSSIQTDGIMTVSFGGNRAYVSSGGQPTVTRFSIMFGWSTVNINSLG